MSDISLKWVIDTSDAKQKLSEIQALLDQIRASANATLGGAAAANQQPGAPGSFTSNAGVGGGNNISGWPPGAGSWGAPYTGGGSSGGGRGNWVNPGGSGPKGPSNAEVDAEIRLLTIAGQYRAAINKINQAIANTDPGSARDFNLQAKRAGVENAQQRLFRKASREAEKTLAEQQRDANREAAEMASAEVGRSNLLSKWAKQSEREKHVSYKKQESDENFFARQQNKEARESAKLQEQLSDSYITANISAKRFSEAIREIEVEMNRAGQGTVRYNRLASQRSRVQFQQDRAENQGQPGGSSGLSRLALLHGLMNPTSQFGSAALLARAGPLGLAAAGAFGAAGIAGQAINFGATSSTLSQNVDLTEAQRFRRRGEAIPLVGGLLSWGRNRIEDFNGTTERMRFSQALDERTQARHAQWYGGQGAISEMRFNTASSANLRNIMAGATVDPMAQFDRRNITGEQEYQENQLRFQQRDRTAQSRREAEAAALDAASAREEEQRAALRLGSARARREHFGSQLTNLNQRENSGQSTENRALREELTRETVQAARDIEAAEASVAEIRNRRIQIDQRLAQARSANRQDLQAELQIEVSIVRAREQRMTAAAVSFGSMNVLQRQQAAMAVEQYRMHGREGVTDEVFRLAMNSPARAGIERDLERVAENSPEYQQILQSSFVSQRDRAPLSAIRTELGTIQQGLRESVLSDAQRLASDMQASFTGAVNLMIQALNRTTALIGERIREAQIRGANGQPR